LYCIVSKFSPTRFGRRNVFFVKSHVPSPTVKVLDEYELEPGGDRASAGAMAAMGDVIYPKPALRNVKELR